MPRYLDRTRVQKSSSTIPSLREQSSSPFSALRRSKSFGLQQNLAKTLDSAASEDDDEDDVLLGDTGKVVQTYNVASVQEVTAAMQHSINSMFSPLPDRAGMNSTRIAEVLNFQKNLPPTVSVAHVHAIISASSRTEREIQKLLGSSELLKLKITGRGNDISGLSEVLVSMRDYEKLLYDCGISQETTILFLDVLSRNSRQSSIDSRDLPSDVATILVNSGFLVSSSFTGSRNLSLSGSSLTGMPKISRAASGSSAAIGGDAAFEQLGGVGSGQRSKSNPDVIHTSSTLVLSAPNIGLFLRLLEAGRNHLLGLLRRSKHRQSPLYLLRERWDGAVDSDSRVSQAKRLRGEFSRIFPAKTKKWKDLNGLNFDWALEECLGAGLIELFETHAVGLGVRLLV